MQAHPSNIIRMAKIIVLMMDKQYPFLEKVQQGQREEVTMVRQTIKVTKNQKNNTLAKANFLKNLKNRFLVKVDSIYEEENKLHIMYEYVRDNLKYSLQNATVQQFFTIRDQLQTLSTYLANIGVRVLLTLDRLGFDSRKIVKFFMGLEFQWEREPEQDFLERYYESQVEQLLHSYYPEESFHNFPTSHQFKDPYQIEDKIRKVSFATLPSRFNRYKSIGRKLNNLKVSSQEKKTDPNIQSTPNIRSFSNAETVPRNYPLLKQKQRVVRKVNKRVEDRKFSGDIRTELFSRKKLEERQNDIKSEYGHNKRFRQRPRINEESNQSEADTHRTKSRIEEMKNKEYNQIANSNKHYLKDFLSVLEEDEEGSPTQLHKKAPDSPVHLKSSGSSLCTKPVMGSQTSFGLNCVGMTVDLQQKARDAIKNSMKVMQKFKSFIHNG